MPSRARRQASNHCFLCAEVRSHSATAAGGETFCADCLLLLGRSFPVITTTLAGVETLVENMVVAGEEASAIEAFISMNAVELARATAAAAIMRSVLKTGGRATISDAGRAARCAAAIIDGRLLSPKELAELRHAARKQR